MLSSPCASRRWKSGMIAALIAACVVLGLGASAAQPASLYSLVPLNSPVTASVDVPWVWQAAAALRAQPNASMGLHAMEQGLGFSLEKDLLSWAGQTAVAITDINQHGPAGALFVQIRDADHLLASARLEAIITKLVSNGAKTTWLSMDLKGVSIRRTEIAQGGTVLKIATANMDGWLVITFGDGVIRKIVDTRNGESPALTSHPLFAKATGGLPENAIGQLCVNGQGILAQIAQNDADTARGLKDTELGKFFLAGSMTCPADTLTFDTVYCSSSPTTQATLQRLRTNAGTVTGLSLAQQPEGTFATLLLRNPDAWIAAAEQLALDSASDADTKNDIRQGFGEIDDVRTMLKRCSGEIGIAGAWHDGDGFGVTLAGETGTADEATTAATSLRGFLEKQEVQVAKTDNLFTLPETQGDEKMFPTLLCWTTRKQWLLGGSHPSWIMQPETTPTLALPDFAKDANLVILGDFTFLPTFAKSMGLDAQALAMIPTAQLGPWGMALKIDEDGGAVRCHATGAMPIIGTMAAVLFPVFSKARGKAQETGAINDLRQLVIAAQIYAQENDERLPMIKTSADIKRLLAVDDNILVSPRTKQPYAFNTSIAGKTLGVFKDPTSVIIFYEATPEPDGRRCAAYLDGHVAYISADGWAEEKRKSHLP